MSCYLNRGGRLPRAGDGFKTKCCDARNRIFGARADLRKYRKWVKHTSPDAILTDTPVRESRNRVLPAIRNNGFGAPYQRIVINLGPADVKKEGSAFDLPMAVGILGGHGLLAKQDVSDYLMVGELSLDGKLRPVKGVLSIAMLARDQKIPHVLVPLGNAREAAVVDGVAVYPVRTLTEVVDFINGTRSIEPVRSDP